MLDIGCEEKYVEKVIKEAKNEDEALNLISKYMEEESKKGNQKAVTIDSLDFGLAFEEGFAMFSDKRA